MFRESAFSSSDPVGRIQDMGQNIPYVLSHPRGFDEVPISATGDDLTTLVDKFFDDIIRSKIGIDSKKEETGFIVVNHVVPTLLPFLKILSKIGRIAAIIPKGSHKDEDILKEIAREYKGCLFEDIQKTARSNAW
jgi:hypothetical protein